MPAPSPRIDTPFTRQLGIDVPIIAGAMYPCSNTELVAAVSEAGGIGIVQPISLTYVHGYGFREGLKAIRKLTTKPVGMNALIEQSSKKYRQRMERWLDIALEEGIRFFVTSLGKPGWVVQRVHAAGGLVYHDATELKWARKGMDEGVDGLIAVNNRAGGHAGGLSAAALYQQLQAFKLPLVCAGGIGAAQDFVQTLQQGYAAVQMGTRFIASRECNASTAYKQAICQAQEGDIVLSERITGVPVSVINTPYVQKMGIHTNRLEKWLLRQRKSRHLMRMLYALKSLYQLKQASLNETSHDYWQAGKSVAGIQSELRVADIIDAYVDAWLEANA